MTDFAKLKSMRGTKSLEAITAELTKFNTNQSDNKKDERFWYPEVDKAGNGHAVIRFLPAPGEEDVPFVRIFEHGFKGPTGSWYIENSLTTLGQKDPVGEYNSQLWNTGLESDKEIARKQKRKLGYISNIYVITDQQSPQNEGKVFLFKCGKKIWDKLNEAMNPEFADEDAMNPFDLWSGANFKLKIRNVEGYRNYDKSEFAAPAPLADDDEMEKIWRKTHSLQAFIHPKNFKSYDELKAKLNRVLGLDGSTVGKTPAAARVTASDDIIEELEKAPAPKFKATAAQKFDEDEDDDLEFFNKLAKD
jgi:gp32 DNA binding protein like